MHSQLRASIEERLGERGAQRARLLIATAAYLAGRVLVDDHLAGSEAQQIRRVLASDFGEEELEWMIEALAEHRDALRSVEAFQWVTALSEALLPEARAISRDELATHVISTLQLRWPMHVDTRRSLETQTLKLEQDGIQIGRPSYMHSLFVRLRDLESLEPVQPWPQILIEWREGKQLLRARAGPYDDPEAFEAAVEALFDALEPRVPASKLPTGWLALERAVWEDVDALPSEHAPVGSASYREAPVRDPVVAVRPARGGLGVMLEWLASRPSRPFRSMVREAVLTEKWLYVRRRDGRVQRIPLALLTGAEGERDAVYRFGRGTKVVLTNRRECEVCRALDARGSAPLAAR